MGKYVIQRQYVLFRKDLTSSSLWDRHHFELAEIEKLTTSVSQRTFESDLSLRLSASPDRKNSTGKLQGNKKRL